MGGIVGTLPGSRRPSTGSSRKSAAGPQQASPIGAPVRAPPGPVKYRHGPLVLAIPLRPHHPWLHRRCVGAFGSSDCSRHSSLSFARARARAQVWFRVRAEVLSWCAAAAVLVAVVGAGKRGLGPECAAVGGVATMYLVWLAWAQVYGTGVGVVQ